MRLWNFNHITNRDPTSALSYTKSLPLEADECDFVHSLSGLWLLSGSTKRVLTTVFFVCVTGDWSQLLAPAMKMLPILPIVSLWPSLITWSRSCVWPSIQCWWSLHYFTRAGDLALKHQTCSSSLWEEGLIYGSTDRKEAFQFNS